jgi:DNA-binding GntR family transcriptional regulator
LEVIEQHRSIGKQRLPTLNGLAAGAGVSPVPMLKVIHEFRQRGLLSSKRGRGIHLSEPADTARPRDAVVPGRDTPADRKWESVALRLQQAVLSGRHTPGAVLPTNKELMEQYGTCYRTLRKALRWLVQQRMLEQYRRGYRVAAVRRSQAHVRVAMVAAENSFGQLQRFTARSEELLRSLESQCAKVNADLEILTYNRSTRALRTANRRVALQEFPAAREEYLGFVVWAMGMPQEALREALLRIGRTGRPVAVLDETGQSRLPSFPKTPVNACVFSMAYSRLPGQVMARYLLDLGHRHLAYICPFHDNAWSPNRLAGLKGVYASAGHPDAVHAFTLDTYHDPWQLVTQSQEIREQIDSMLAPRGRIDGESSMTLGRTLDVLRQRIDFILEREAPRDKLLPLVEEALRRKEITAWVAASDSLALLCLDFLRSRGLRVPEDISVVGFDDSPDAFAQNLTSYNFDCPTAVAAMLGHIRGTHGSARRRVQEVELEGFVTQRLTSGRARNAKQRSRARPRA